MKEAQIVMEAGRPGMVTIATNMAGRGTDIVLGGGISKALEQIDNDETLSDEQKKAQKEEIKAKWQVDHDRVVELGGLRIIGSERHESRRIDNQLRGRSGRQGDPGSSRFYLSMEDPLLRIFAGEKMQALMNKLRLPEGEAIEAGIVSAPLKPLSARSNPATSIFVSSCLNTMTWQTIRERKSTLCVTKFWKTKMCPAP